MEASLPFVRDRFFFDILMFLEGFSRIFVDSLVNNIRTSELLCRRCSRGRFCRWEWTNENRAFSSAP